MKEKLYDIGNTEIDVLYDFAVCLSHCSGSCLDPKSELYEMFNLLCRSAWGQLPDVVVIDMRDPDTTPSLRDLQGLSGYSVAGTSSL